MKINKSTLYLALAFMVTACTDESPETGTNPKQVSAEITAGIAGVLPETGSQAAETRASDTNWHAGDVIGLYMLQTGTNTISRNMANRRYINSATGSTANFAPDGEGNTAYYPSGGEEVDIIAYYPHNGQLAMDNGQLTVPVDVSNQGNLPAIDLMTSNLSVGHSSAEDKRAARLNFAHRLSKIVLNLKKGEGTEGLNLADATVTIGGTPATAVWDLTAGDFSSRGAATDIELNMIGGSTTGIVIPPGELPQTGSDAVPVTFTVVAGTETFTATLPADKPLGSGKQLDITIRLDYIQSTIETEITDWITGTETTEHAINILQPPGSTGLPEITTFDLWRINTPNDVRTYTWNDVTGKWTATPEPFYIEYIMAGEMFQARHTLSTDPVTTMDDVIETEVIPLTAGYSLALDFSHVNACFALELNPQIFTDRDWKEAIITPAISNPQGNTTTGSLNYEFIVPIKTTVNTGELLATIKFKDINYEVRATSNISFEKNYKTTVSVIIEGTQPGINVKREPWLTSSGSGTVINTDVTANSDLSKLPGDGTITLTSGSKSARYRYEGGNLTSNAPLYWEDFVKYSTGTTLASYEFSFRYVPDAVTSIAHDILYQDDVAIEWGQSLTFDNLLHENAEIVIIFQKGSTYKDDDIDWSTARVELSGFTPNEHILTANEENKNLVTTPVVVAENTSTTGKFIHLELNNIKYKIEMNTLGLSGPTLEGGNSYRLTLTVDKTKIVMDVVKITDFTPVDGSGSIGYNN